MLRFLTAGESHGPCLIAIVEGLPAGLEVRVARVREDMLIFRRRTKVMGAIFLISVVVQLLRVGVHYTAGLSLRDSVPSFGYFLIFIPLIAIVSSIPISFGGIGVRENLGIVLFTRLGMEAGMAFSMEFLAYLIGIAASSIGGAIFVLRQAK